MGVPSFYRWLVGKYPGIVSPAKEHDDDFAATNTGSSSGNGVYHNLYLDMNGIIHPCFHPKDQVCPPTTLDEVFHSMFDYMDHLFRIVRPTNLLYLAVDGVAPRAKMNQQRARRFKSAKAANDAKIEENILRDRFRVEGKELLPREASSEVSDPNVITPGTEFMEKLSQALKYYIRAHFSSDPLWKDIKVILSDANVPGEGEHKIMSFIRAQRGREGYDPNTRHCLYGLDADLIMLALASHEVHFSILREEVLHQNNQENVVPITQNIFTSQEATKFKCRAWFPRITEAKPEGRLPKKPYQFLNIWVLREYLELDMKIPNLVQKLDTERLIDDFVFICFLTGNDFIPHIPSLEIHEGAVDLLIEVYKTSFNKMGGYIVDTDKVKDKHATYLEVSRLEKFFHELSLYEEKIFLKRCQLRENLIWKIERQATENAWNESNSENVEEKPDDQGMMAKSSKPEGQDSICRTDEPDITMNTLELRKKMEDILRNKQDLIKPGACKHDKIKLGSPGWKSRFFKEKFGAETSDEIGKLKNEMVQKYLEGLCWVLGYYFSDVPSWSWYYPFYYAPFASDVKGLSLFKISFSLDKPLKPLDQLMAVLPPESSFALPRCYSKLMDSDDSAIQAYYPSELDIDTDGKRFLWQGIAKLPFIDDKLLLSVTEVTEKALTVHESRRNAVKQEKIFVRNSNALSNNEAFVQTSDCSLQKLPIDPATSEIGGWLSPDDGDDDVNNGLFSSRIENDQAISAKFFNPDAVKPAARLLDNVRIPDKTVTEADISVKPLWHTYPYSRPPVNSMQYVQQSCRPETPCWRPSTPAPPREEIRSAGTGWFVRGRGGNAVAVAPAAETRQSWSSSRYGRGRGSGAATVVGQTTTTRHQWSRSSGSYGRSSGAPDNGGRGSYNLRPGGSGSGGGGGGGAYQRQQQQTAWRPVGSSWGGGRGGNGQPRAW